MIGKIRNVGKSVLHLPFTDSNCLLRTFKGEIKKRIIINSPIPRKSRCLLISQHFRSLKRHVRKTHFIKQKRTAKFHTLRITAESERKS